MRTLLSMALLAVGAAAVAAEGDPLFQDDAPLKVRLTGPLKEIMADRPEDDRSATFSWFDANGRETSADIGLRTRGKFRGDRKVCPFAPLRLNFRKGQVADTLFDGQDKLKLVVDCRPGSARYEQSLLREYLVYRLFNTLDDRSFRVRLLAIEYVDTADPGKPRSANAFLIEDEDRLAARIGMERAKLEKTSIEALDPAYLNLVSMFEYFIGNTDFSPISGPPGEHCCHNTVPMRGAGGVLYPVPYDFDMSGMVDAPYAEPNDRFNIKDVKTRLYRGRCRNNAIVPATLERFATAQPAIETMVADTPGLSASVRKTLRRYVDKFYDVAGDAGRVQKELVGACIE